MTGMAEDDDVRCLVVPYVPVRVMPLEVLISTALMAAASLVNLDHPLDFLP